MAVTAPKVGAGTGSDRKPSILLWRGRITEFSAAVSVLCKRSVLAFAYAETSFSIFYGETA